MWIGRYINSEQDDARRPARMARDSMWHAVNRRGFTLIELLIVIAIIAVIAALGIGAIMLAPQNAKVRGTEALIAKIDAQFKQRLIEFNQVRESITPLPAEVVIASEGGVPNPQRARVIAIKRAMRQSFPEMFYIDPALRADGRDNDFDGATDWPSDNDECIVGQWKPVDYDLNVLTVEQVATQLPPFALAITNYIRQIVAENPTIWDPTQPANMTHRPGTARAECLYMIVTKCGTEVADFSADEIKDTDGDGLPEFVDKFGNPIQFFLWPSYYSSPLQNPGSERDSDDPNQMLTEPGWFATAGGANRSTFERFMHTVSHFRPSTPGNAIQPKGFVMRPLIVSAGPDGGFGFWGDPALIGEDRVMGTLDDTDPTGPAQKRYPAIGWMLSVGPNGMVDPTPSDDGQPVVAGQPLRISAAMRISDVFQSNDPNKPDGYGQDQDNIDNHHLRVK
jgi:prepilin-type N-terminal cleavage/methylation domain-containing protein